MSGDRDLIERLRRRTARAAAAFAGEGRPPQDQTIGKGCRGSGQPSVSPPPNFSGQLGTNSKCPNCDWTASRGPGSVLLRHPVTYRPERWT